MSDTKKKRKTYTLKEKREIAKASLKGMMSASELENSFNITSRVVRTSLELSSELINLESDDPILENYNINKSKVNYLMNIDQYILNGIKQIRKAGGMC
jgi:hypothetical protein